MNPAEQQAHRTKTAQLEARVASLEVVLDHMGRFLAEWHPIVDAHLQLHGTTLRHGKERAVLHRPHPRSRVPQPRPGGLHDRLSGRDPPELRLLPRDDGVRIRSQLIVDAHLQLHGTTLRALTHQPEPTPDPPAESPAA